MGKWGVLLTSLGLLAALHGTSSSATLPSKVWVANWGDDSASCGPAGSPCASLQQAHDNVVTGGEIRLLTPGDYGGAKSPGLSITKSVTIVYEGPGEAGILGARDGPAISINAGLSGVVTLRGLTIDGQGIASEGVLMRSAAAVHIHKGIIRNFERLGGGIGISLVPAADTQLFVSDTIIANNGASAASGGIAIRPSGSSASAKVVLERTVVDKNIVGLRVDGTGSTGKGVHILIRDSVVSANAGDGILVTSAPGKAPTFIIVERSAAVNNAGTGIRVEGPLTTVLLRDAVTTGNDTALSTINGGQLISYRHKQVEQPYRPVAQPLRKAENVDDANPAIVQADATSGASATAPMEIAVSPVLQPDAGPDASRLDPPNGPVARGQAAIGDRACPSSRKLKRLKLHYGKNGRWRLAGAYAASHSYAKVRKSRRFR
jgi:hypothetical protein